MVTLHDIEQAAARLQGQVLETPCVESRTLSQLTGAQVFPQVREPAVHRLLQGTRRLQQAGPARAGPARARRGRDVGRQPCAGRCLHAQRLGLRAVIVMPRFTPGIRSSARAASAPRSCCTATRSTRRAHALALADAQGLTLVHPYDDPTSSPARARSAWRCCASSPTSRRWWSRPVAAA